MSEEWVGGRGNRNYGWADLDDPADLLEGTGKKLRHVKVRPGEPLPEEGIRALLREAFEPRG